MNVSPVPVPFQEAKKIARFDDETRKKDVLFSLLICRYPPDLAPYNAGCRGFIGPFPPPLSIRDFVIIGFILSGLAGLSRAFSYHLPEYRLLFSIVQNLYMTFSTNPVIMPYMILFGRVWRF